MSKGDEVPVALGLTRQPVILFTLMDTRTQLMIRSDGTLCLILPAHNEERNLPQVLASLEPLSALNSVEILIVDAGSTDRTGQIASSHGFKVIRENKVFPGVARNLGVSQCSSEILALLDADVEVTNTWIGRVKEIISDPTLLDKTITGAPYGIREKASWIERTWFKSDQSRQPTYINGGNILMLRDDFLQLGGFREDLPTGEDYELCQRAQSSGFQIRLDDSLKTIHLGNPSTAWQFIAREAWHGAGDLISLSSLASSKVALGTLTFIISTLSFLAALLFGQTYLGILSFFGLVSLCLYSSFRKWRRVGLIQILMGAFVFFLYYIGRSLGMVIPNSRLGVLRTK